MRKKELIKNISDTTGIKADEVSQVLNAFFAAVAVAVGNGEKVSLSPFGDFSSKFKKERVGRNVKTGQEIIIPAKYTPVFRAGKALKDLAEREA